MTGLAACVDEILKLGLDDWIQAAEVGSVARTVGGATSDAEVQRLSFAVIRELLAQGLVTAGDVSPDGFVPWSVGLESAIARIESEWRVVVRPGLGEVCWLSNTAAGDAKAGRV